MPAENNPLKDTESKRIKALREYNILDTGPEAGFDDLTTLASEICGTPIALVSLIDADRQFFKSRLGLDVSETSRKASFCAHAILQPDLMVVPDALADDRFAANPLVTGNPKIRFYAGSPLFTSDGYGLGTLCVIDTQPRTLTAGQKKALQALARQAMAQLELRRTLEQMKLEAQRKEKLIAELEETIRPTAKK
mgnify:CR=1 FL=1